MINRLRNWLLIKLANGRPVAMNLNLSRGLYFRKSQGLFSYNVNITNGDSAPDGLGFYMGDLK